MYSLLLTLTIVTVGGEVDDEKGDCRGVGVG